MAAGNTYTQIASTTLGSAASSVTFSSISGAYTDLVLILNGIDSSGGVAALQIRFNSDTGNNYSRTSISGDGTSANSDRNTSAAQVAGGLTTGSVQYTNIVNFMNYSNATTYKTSLFRANVSNALIRASVGLWRNTAAITIIEVLPGNATFASGSTFNLYGITAA